jgi:Zn-dependent protease with chaperone function
MNTTTMDFFAHQDRARRQTSLLIGYYVLAVALIALGVYAAFAAVFLGAEAKTAGAFDWRQAWNPRLFAAVVGGTLLVVLIGTLYKIAQLARGGEAIARMLGGRPVAPDTADAAERRLINVVEEMAIASGIPVPRVFLLDEEKGINAFAAGFEPSNAVIGVTRGCLQTLSRDELQGVIAHEFSHILNGDMRLNLRLVGILNGILVIALVGYGLMRVMSSSSRSRSRNEKGGGAAVGIFLLGLLLMLIGYIGVFFGKLIKSAVSRQREFLADASAVQFTRNPIGIAGALATIAGYKGGTRLATSHAEETSHFFFANGLRGSFLGLLATHPPLDERIRRIDPAFVADRADAAAPPAQSPAPTPLTAGVSGLAATPAAVVARVGAPQAAHLVYAGRLMEALPAPLLAAVRNPNQAPSVVYGLLLSADTQVREKQLAILAARNPSAHATTLALVAPLDTLGGGMRLPLVDLALPALRGLAAEERREFRQLVEALVEADAAIDLFEYTLQRLLRRHLDPAHDGKADAAARYRDLTPLQSACADLLGCLAGWGTDDPVAAKRAFQAGARELELENLAQPPADACGLQKVDEALNQLSQAAPPLKRRIIAACSACVGSDARVTTEEAELLRAIADSLGCPLPPFLPD